MFLKSGPTSDGTKRQPQNCSSPRKIGLTADHKAYSVLFSFEKWTDKAYIQRKLIFSQSSPITLWSVNLIFPHRASVNQWVLQMSAKMIVFIVTSISQFFFYLWPSGADWRLGCLCKPQCWKICHGDIHSGWGLYLL